MLGFNQRTLLAFADFLDRNGLVIIKSNPLKPKTPFRSPDSAEEKSKLLDKIVDAVNDGFYSDASCMAYIRGLIAASMGEGDKDFDRAPSVSDFVQNLLFSYPENC